MRKYKSFTAILLTAALVSSVTACSRNAAQIDSSVEASESTSGVSSSGNDIETTEAEKAEETMAASSEEETEESTAAAETSGTEATAEEQSETEETSEDDSEETTRETTTKASETAKTPQTTKAPETSKAPQTTKATETTKAAVKPQSITASVSGTHYVGDTLTGADFAVTVTMSDGSTLTNPAGWSANPLVLSSTSNQITVAYEGVSTTITVKASERPAAATSTQPSQTATTAAQIATTVDPHAGMVLADDGQWHETKADGEELQPGDVVYVDGQWHVLSPNYGQEIEPLIADQDWSYELARMYFEKENEIRAEAGAPPMTWSDELYEVAKKCAKVCGDAEGMRHDLTSPYRKYTYVTNSGVIIEEYYAENLLLGSAALYDKKDMAWEVESGMDAIKNSPPHYDTLVFNSGSHEEAAVAVYRSDWTLYVSFIFHHVDGDLEDIENN